MRSEEFDNLRSQSIFKIDDEEEEKGPQQPLEAKQLPNEIELKAESSDSNEYDSESEESDEENHDGEVAKVLP